MNGVNSLIADGVLSFKRRRDDGVYCDLGQVKVRMSSSHLLQAILESFTIVDATWIEEGLGNAKLRHSVNSSPFLLFTKRGHFRRQIGLCLFRFLEPMGLFRKCFSLSCQLLVKGTDDLRVLSLLLIFNLLALVKPLDHPFAGYTPILKGLHVHQRMRQSMMVKIKRIIKVQHK